MISTAIMAHPSRAALAETLWERLGGELVFDEKGDEWDTGRRALLAYDPRAEWHAVIQDDAILSTHFDEALELACAHAGDKPIGLYVGKVRPMPRTIRKAVRAAQIHGCAWLEGHGPRWGVGVAIPTRFIPALVASADLYSHPHYDARLTHFFKTAGVYCRYPVPSLVDHDPERESLIDSAGGDRRAHVFLGDDDPAGIDWAGEPVLIDRRGRVSVPAGSMRA